jgi:hypothetical protein
MTALEEGKTGSRYSRRGLLRRAGLGAGAIALSGGIGGGVAPEAQAARSATAATSPTTFGRLFPQLPAFAPATERVKDALRALGAPGGQLDAKDDLSKGPRLLITDLGLSANNPNNPTHTAGTTFMGQFIDHDTTFDTTSAMGVPTDSGSTPNARTPSLDLDSVYGAGPVASPQLYDPLDHAKLRIDTGGIFEDLPRTSDGTNSAIIADPRNDENLMIAGLQCAFIRFHNNAVEWARANGYADSAYEQARQLTTWHYHWLVLHEFLPQVVGQALVDEEGPPLLQATPARRLHTGGVPGGRVPVRPQHGAAVVPRQSQGGRRQPVLRDGLRPRRRGASRPRRSPRRRAFPAPLHRLADLLRLRRRRGEAEQENRHEDLDAAL